MTLLILLIMQSARDGDELDTQIYFYQKHWKIIDFSYF